jgi:nitrite reductase (NADH) small subunit
VSSALVEGVATGIIVDGRSVMVARVDEVVLATTDVCPHAGARLSGGVIRNGCITCPSHLWRFSLSDGTKQGDERVGIAVYPTREVDGVIEVDLPDRPAARSLREVLLAHARGEPLELDPEHQEW